MDDLLREFLTESAEGLSKLDVEIIQLEQNPHNPALLDSIFRVVHTIKGTCGFIGLPRLEQLAHAAENVFGKFRDGELPVTSAAISLILKSLDTIKILLGQLEKNGTESPGEDKELIAELNAAAEAASGAIAEDMFVTMTIAGQLFGVPVMQVQDVLGPQKITRVPLAPPEVLGSLNLRGRIVTAIDVCARLGLPRMAKDAQSMSVVVEQSGELYSLAVDQIGEVMSVPSSDYEKNPATLNLRWREVSAGVYRLKHCLLVILDIGRLLRVPQERAA